uniref:PDZ domain-containing protein n=1 Tax=Noctiluca scintillans TaxID=2966 RepID=A0A7S1AEF7_NOCSC
MGTHCCCEERNEGIPLSSVKGIPALLELNSTGERGKPPMFSPKSEVSRPSSNADTPHDAFENEDTAVREETKEADGGPVPQLEMRFELPDDQGSKTLVLTKKPVGMRFAGKGRIRVTAIFENFHAEELGIKTGWVVTHIDGEDIQEKSEIAARELLQAKMKSLRVM